MPAARRSRHGIEFVHVSTPCRFARIVRGMDRSVVADTGVLKPFVSCRAVFLSEERPKECAIDLAQSLGRKALIGTHRRIWPWRNDSGEGRLSGRGVWTTLDVRKRRIDARTNILNGHGHSKSLRIQVATS
jgi:hypothetical protein